MPYGPCRPELQTVRPGLRRLKDTAATADEPRVTPRGRVIPRDEALYRLSVFAAAGCIAVMLAALFAGPSTSLDRQGLLIAVSVLAIGACFTTLVTVERLLRALRRQRAETVEAAPCLASRAARWCCAAS